MNTRREWLEKFGLTPGDAGRIERAMSTLAAFEEQIEKAGMETGEQQGEILKPLQRAVDQALNGWDAAHMPAKVQS